MAVLLGLFSVFVAFTTNGYIHKIREESKQKINESFKIATEYVLSEEKVPRKVIDPYVFFIMDANDGSYIVEREDKTTPAHILWEQYRTKLTYQMQRQKRGWISYPDRENLWKYFQRYRVIRYSVIEDQEKIVVLEDVFPSAWELFQKVINQKNIADLMLVVIVGLLLFNFVIDRFFEIITNHIKDSLTGNILDFKPAASEKRPGKGGSSKRVTRKPLDIYFDEKVSERVTPQKPKTTFPVNDETIKPPQEISDITIQKENKEDTPRPQPEIKIKPPEPKTSEKQKMSKEDDQESRPQAEIPPRPSVSPSDNWTVSVQGIKSPVLKQMLKELREKREKR
jgi:hypothetical protein